MATPLTHQSTTNCIIIIIAITEKKWSQTPQILAYPWQWYLCYSLYCRNLCTKFQQSTIIWPWLILIAPTNAPPHGVPSTTNCSHPLVSLPAINLDLLLANVRSYCNQSDASSAASNEPHLLTAPNINNDTCQAMVPLAHINLDSLYTSTLSWSTGTTQFNNQQPNDPTLWQLLQLTF